MAAQKWTPEKDRQLCTLLSEIDNEDRINALRYRTLRDLYRTQWAINLITNATSIFEINRLVDEKAAEIEARLAEYAPKAAV